MLASSPALGGFRWLSAAALAAAALAASSVPSFAQTAPTTATSSVDCTTIHFGLSNPHAGDTLFPGGYVLEGFAFDTAASSQQGRGVDRVDIFLDDRNQGGLSVGSVNFTQPSTSMLPASPLGVGGFTVQVKLPELTGGHTLSAYARSSVTGHEQVLSVPIQVGENDEDIAPAVAPAMSAQRTCTTPAAASSTAPAAASTMAQPTTAAPSTAAPAATAPTTAAMAPTTTAPATTAPSTATVATPLHLRLLNPQPGDTLQSGAYEIDGVATDARATQGGGVDRVQLFLGDRNQGGLFLGQALIGQTATADGTPSQFGPGGFNLVAQLPNQHGGQSLFGYARSAVTGEELVVVIPVQLGNNDDDNAS